MVDTHTHIYCFEEDNGIAALQRARQAGVNHLVLPNINLESVNQIKVLHSDFPDCTSCALGLHPTELTENWRNELALIEKEWGNMSAIAIGEIGIDLYWSNKFEKAQREAFAYQLDMAAERNLPVIIHSRNALDIILEDIDRHAQHRGKLVGMIFHSFTGSSDDAEKILSTVPDAYFGINGVATFKNAKEVREAISHIGADRIVLETDSPYLAPVPNRGKRNESSYLPYILKTVADTLNIQEEKLEAITDKNARNIVLNYSD